MTVIRIYDCAFHTTARNNPTGRWEWQSQPPAGINEGGQMHGLSNELPVAREEAFHSEPGFEDGNNFLWHLFFVCEQGEELAIWKETAASEEGN